jgi:hypothetical protein
MSEFYLFIATALAGAAILLIPGTLCLLLTPSAADLRWAEGLAFGAAISWCLLATSCVVAFLFGLNVLHVEAALFCANVVLLAMWLRRVPRVIFRRPDASEIAVLVMIAVVAVLAYRVGGYTNAQLGPAVGSGWSTMEEPLQISTIRKIEYATSLRVAEVMYAKGESSTYYYPVYPFALAVISRTAGLDPMILFDSFRLWTAALALLALYTLATGAFGRTAGVIMMFTAFALLLGGNAGQASGLGSWGQLIPISHIGDFGLGVLLPLALAIVVRIAGQNQLGLAAGLLSVAFLLSMAVTHAREAAHVTSYMGATLIIAPLIGAFDRHRWLRFAAVTAGTVLLVSFFSAGVQRRVPFLAEHEQASAARARLNIDAALQDKQATWVHTADVPGVLKPYVALGFLVASMSLVWWRRRPGAVVLLSGVLLWWLPLHVPIAGHLLERVVYSEIMMTPSRYVFQVSYLLYGAIVYAMLMAIDFVIALTQSRVVRTWIALACAPIAALAVARLPEIGERLFDRPLIGAGVAVALAVAVAVVAWRTALSHAPVRDPALRHPQLATVCGVIILASLVARSHESLLFAAGGQRGRARTADVEAWYEQTGVSGTLPWSVVRMLRTAVPSRSVIAADPALGLAIPLAADQYVLVSGTNFTSDLHYLDAVQRVTGGGFDEHAVDWGAYRAKLGEEPAGRMRQDVLTWERYNQRLTWLVAVGTPGARRHTPIFSNNEPAEVTLRLLSDLHPDYVLLTPTQHARLFQLMVSAPHRFARVAAEGDFQLYRVRPAASSQ